MITKAYGVTFSGIQPVLVQVEAHLQRGLPKFDVVGLGDAAVREGKNRIQSALVSSGVSWKSKKIMVNLAPAEIQKDGAALDLPIALSLIGSLGLIPMDQLQGTIAIGELSLDGSLQPVRGTLAMIAHARKEGCKKIILPVASACEAAYFSNLEVVAAQNLSQVIRYLQGEAVDLPKPEIKTIPEPFSDNMIDWSDVKGQPIAKRALEIAAAGGHNLLFSGPPGVGKSFLAKRFPTIMPELTEEEMLEVMTVYSLVGEERSKALHFCPPFREPHHHASLAGFIGGGRPFRPGDVTLAHKGVLFMDELPEYRRDVVEALREPLETKIVTISRSYGTYKLPAQIQLLAAMNLCPCGALGETKKYCLCTPPIIDRYQRKVSSPIRDRIDMHVMLARPSFDDLMHGRSEEKSKTVKERVIQARKIQEKRNGQPGFINSQVSPKRLKEVAPLDGSTEALLSQAMDRFSISARGIHKIISVARTIADVAGEEKIKLPHIAEALSYRETVHAEF